MTDCQMRAIIYSEKCSLSLPTSIITVKDGKLAFAGLDKAYEESTLYMEDVYRSHR